MYYLVLTSDQANWAADHEVRLEIQSERALHFGDQKL